MFYRFSVIFSLLREIEAIFGKSENNMYEQSRAKLNETTNSWFAYVNIKLLQYCNIFRNKLTMTSESL